jgi:hypothetical protein
MQAAWGREDSEQRRRATEEFLRQVQHDALWTHERPAVQSTIWRQYEADMEAELRLQYYSTYSSKETKQNANDQSTLRTSLAKQVCSRFIPFTLAHFSTQ